MSARTRGRITTPSISTPGVSFATPLNRHQLLEVEAEGEVIVEVEATVVVEVQIRVEVEVRIEDEEEEGDVVAVNRLEAIPCGK